YFTSIDSAAGKRWEHHLDSLQAPLSGWEDRAKATGQTPAAAALRLATQDFIAELRSRRPEFVAKTNQDRYLTGRELPLSARATLAWQETSGKSRSVASGIRDVSMADQINTIVGRERRRGYWRGRVLVFAHNGHLQQGPLTLPVPGERVTYWPA